MKFFDAQLVEELAKSHAGAAAYRGSATAWASAVCDMAEALVSEIDRRKRDAHDTDRPAKSTLPLTVADVLREARAKLALPEQWSKMGEAFDHRGHLCDPVSPTAIAWSIAGAIRSVTLDANLRNAAIHFLESRLDCSLEEYNNDPYHQPADVAIFLGCAIEDAEKAVAR